VNLGFDRLGGRGMPSELQLIFPVFMYVTERFSVYIHA
jgi:hypothetical protein